MRRERYFVIIYRTVHSVCVCVCFDLNVSLHVRRHVHDIIIVSPLKSKYKSYIVVERRKIATMTLLFPPA